MESKRELELTTNIYMCIYIWLFNIYTCIHACCTYVCLDIYIYIYMYECVCVCTCAHILTQPTLLAGMCDLM